MEIVRINDLQDGRFREIVLKQHGAFLAGGEPCEVEIVGSREAKVFCKDPGCIDKLIDQFRYFAEHITVFYDPEGKLLKQFPPAELFEVEIAKIQPSQFYVNAEKLAAVAEFIGAGSDVVVPLMDSDGRWIAMDGHTRLRRALDLGETKVLGFRAEPNEELKWFVDQAQMRGIRGVKDLQVISAEEYREKWDRFCDDHFA